MSFLRTMEGRFIYLPFFGISVVEFPVLRFSFKEKIFFRKIKTLKGNRGKPPDKMTIHTNASRTNNHLGYTNGTYLQYLKSDSNLIRCRKSAQNGHGFSNFNVPQNHLRDLVKADPGHPLSFWSGDPKSVCFIRTTGASSRVNP